MTAYATENCEDRRSTRFGGLIVFLLASLCGCAHFEPRPLDPARNVQRLEGRSLSDPGLRAFIVRTAAPPPAAWPPVSWNLQWLTLAALYFHPEVASAEAQWATAQAAVKTAGQRPNPTLSVTPLYNITTSRSLMSPWNVPADLQFPIETAGKRGARKRRAHHLSRAAWWRIAATAWRIRRGVQTNLLKLQSAQESARLAGEQSRVQDALVARLRSRLDAGEISPFELAQARGAAQSFRLAQLDAVRQVGEARVQLATAMGLSVSELVEIRFEFSPLEGLVPDIPIQEARQRALLRRPDILSSLEDYAAAQEALRLEIARQYPDVNLGPGYEFDQDNNKWGLGVSLTLPLMNQNQGPIAEAQARRVEAEALFNGLQARVLGEIDRAHAAYQAQRETAAAAQSLLALSLRQEERVRARKEAGAVSSLDLLAARAQALKARQAWLLERVRLRQAFYDLENALQRPDAAADAPGSPGPPARSAPSSRS